MALNTALIARARYFVDALNPYLPLIHIQVYVPHENNTEASDLYLLGFILKDVLLGGYAIAPPLVTADCGLTVLRAASFFDDAWQEGKSRFFPEELRALYQLHLAGEAPWWRVV